MRTPKWFVLLSVVFWLAFTLVSIWAMEKAGVREIAQQQFAAFFARRTIEHYLASTEVRKLQIGAGTNNLPGWLNTDIEPREGQSFLDAMKSFPIPDNSLKYIYAEQVIEHLPLDGALAMLRESRRVLAPGGKLRLATPDLRQLVALFDQDQTEAERRFMTAQLKLEGLSVKESERPLFIMNMYFHRWGHQFLYDQQTLRSLLESLGFRDVHFLRHGESDDPELRNIERHTDMVGSDIDKYVTMIVQASK